MLGKILHHQNAHAKYRPKNIDGLQKLHYKVSPYTLLIVISRSTFHSQRNKQTTTSEARHVEGRPRRASVWYVSYHRSSAECQYCWSKSSLGRLPIPRSWRQSRLPGSSTTVSHRPRIRDTWCKAFHLHCNDNDFQLVSLTKIIYRQKSPVNLANGCITPNYKRPQSSQTPLFYQAPDRSLRLQPQLPNTSLFYQARALRHHRPPLIPMRSLIVSGLNSQSAPIYPPVQMTLHSHVRTSNLQRKLLLHCLSMQINILAKLHVWANCYYTRTSVKGPFYNGDRNYPVWTWHEGVAPSGEEALNAIVEAPVNQMCTSVPKGVQHNCAFHVDLTCLRHQRDLFSDDLGACMGMPRLPICLLQRGVRQTRQSNQRPTIWQEKVWHRTSRSHT